jgi:insertion element IS1 protein InsB
MAGQDMSEFCAPEVDHYISKVLTQRLERTNAILRQQTLSLASTTKQMRASCGSVPVVTLRLVLSYFNWIWRHSYLGTTAAQRAELTDSPGTWNDIVTYPTLL